MVNFPAFMYFSVFVFVCLLSMCFELARVKACKIEVTVNWGTRLAGHQMAFTPNVSSVQPASLTCG